MAPTPFTCFVPEDDEHMQLVTISAPHAQPHHEGKYRCNAIHPTFHRLRVHKVGHHHNGTVLILRRKTSHEPITRTQPHENMESNESESDDPPPPRFFHRTTTVSIDQSPHHAKTPHYRHDNSVTRLVAGRPDELNEFEATEAYAEPPIKILEDITKEDSYSGEVEQIVDVNGKPWLNPVFRNSSLDPELFVATKKADDEKEEPTDRSVTIEKPEAEKEATTDRSMVTKHNSKLHHQHGQYHMKGHIINSNECLACLAKHGGLSSGEVTSEDSVRKLEQLINGVPSEASTTALVVYSLPTMMPGLSSISLLPKIGLDLEPASAETSGLAPPGERLLYKSIYTLDF